MASSKSQKRTSSHQSSSDSESSSSDIDDNCESLSNLSINLYDNACFVIVCEQHRRIMLTKGNTKFFPYVNLIPSKTWFENSVEGALKFLLGRVSKRDMARYKSEMPFAQFVLLHILRFQLPQSLRFITRLTFLVKLNPEMKEIKCCSNDHPRVKWFPLDEARSAVIENLWGPEVSYFSNAINRTVTNTLEEYSLENAIKNIGHEVWLSDLLSHLTMHDIERVYGDFLLHAFPSFFLTRDSFRAYMILNEIETKTKVVQRLFAAFRIRGKTYLQFSELLLGLAAIDARSPHADARVKFVFRYYDYDKDGYLDFKEFKRMLSDLVPKPSDRVAKEEMRRIGAVNQANKGLVLSFEQFKAAVGSHTFRGTSRLCRVALSPFTQITRSIATRKVSLSMGNYKPKELLLNRPYQGKCVSCKSRQPYEIASTLVVLGEDGFSTRFQPVVLTSQVMHRKRVKSLETTFNPQSICHFLMDQIREFNHSKGTPKSYKGLFSSANSRQKEIFFSNVQQICNSLSDLLEREERVLKVPEPVYIIGDIHGNLEDLLSLEKSLWRSVPLLTSNYLFLGDFVDRGKWGFECFLYLAVLKLLCPRKVFLLRGNHEVRPIQMKYSFHKELTFKYGDRFGQAIFDLFNMVFDRLPFCAVVNQSVYCAHGGLTSKAIDLQAMNQDTPHCLSNPEVEANWVWETLWSDPIEFAAFEEAAAFQGIAITTADDSYMFQKNTKRGTSVLFNEHAVIAFLRHNRLQYIIRAHEVPADGFKFNFGRLCTTIFSCSHYCRNDNEAAVIQIGREGRIRVIRIDTTHNSPAMVDN